MPGMPDLGALFSQIQSLHAAVRRPHQLGLRARPGPQDRRAVQRPVGRPQRQKDAVADAVRLADHWLDETTAFPSGVTSTAAWSRAEWIVGTADVWKVLVEPIAEGSVAGARQRAARGGRPIAGPMLGILGKAVGAMLA